MLSVSRDNKPKVAAALGYDVVEFREGFLERIPVETNTVDLVTSNCVVNLSPDKPRVFEEIWRILKDHGRIVISDIVSAQEVPPHLKVDPRLWGECLVGALTQEEFLARLERAGFYGLTVLQRSYWKDVEGYPFHSLTVQGFQVRKSGGLRLQRAPGGLSRAGQGIRGRGRPPLPAQRAYEVCTDTVAKLRRPPYKDIVAILEPGAQASSYACCSPDGACC